MTTKVYDKNGNLCFQYTHQTGVAFEDACKNVPLIIKMLEDTGNCKVSKVKVIAKKKRARFIFD